MQLKYLPIVVPLLIAIAAPLQAAITVHNSDFIADGSRSHFNGFEAVPNNGTHYTGGNGPYTEDSISVEQVNGQGVTWVTFVWPGSQGDYSWYPDGGDLGYTQITSAGGSDFDSVGFNYGSGAQGDSGILVELLNDGNVVLSTSAFLNDSGPNYIGFSGGGFDTIRARDLTNLGNEMVTDGSFQALVIDSIETQDVEAAVPEPATLTIWGLGALGCMVAAYGRKRLTPKKLN
jgi:hypothetical protein